MAQQLSSRLRSMKFMKRKEPEESKPTQENAFSSTSISTREEGIEAVVVDETNVSVLGPELNFSSFQGRSSFLNFNPRLESILNELRNVVPQSLNADTEEPSREGKRRFQHNEIVEKLKKKKRKVNRGFSGSQNKAFA